MSKESYSKEELVRFMKLYGRVIGNGVYLKGNFKNPDDLRRQVERVEPVLGEYEKEVPESIRVEVDENNFVFHLKQDLKRQKAKLERMLQSVDS